MLLLQKNKTAKEKLMEISILFVILVSIFTIFKTVEVYKSNKYIGQENRNLISFSGEGEVFAVADVATFSFSVVEEAKTSSEALSKSAEKMNSVIDYLKEQNIAEKDIKTINYSVNPRYEWRDLSVSSIRPEGERVLIAYEANQTLSVKIRNTEKAGEILVGVGSFDVSNVSGLNFEIDDTDALQREARKLAIEDAKVKAKELASDLGIKLVRIVSFNESGIYPYYAAATKAYGLGGAEDAVSIPQIPVGENKITSNVNITYEIR